MDKGKNKSVTKKITVWGAVQGVGFRPFVFLLAKKHNIVGSVKNHGGLVEIIVQGTQGNVDAFLKALKAADCANCELTRLEAEDTAFSGFDDFKIIESDANDQTAIVPPDLAVCPDCQRELYDSADRRFGNPFISCMSCGPRYSIIKSLPYDRENTSMDDFSMCGACKAEYTLPQNRRFYAQTISCNDCGPYLICESGGVRLEEKAALTKAADIIKGGGIVAVKGIGGYHFCCSPFKEETVLNLRELKGREQKPFAVMFGDIDSVRQFCTVSEADEKLLKSAARPIVLLAASGKAMAYQTAKASFYCGAFLPYTPLQMLLVRACGPLIMTSANISDSPIIKDDADMLSVNSPLLGGVLYHEREICRSVDDSVVKVTAGELQMIRRSRGYVPYPVFLNSGDQNIQIFAAGGDLKAAFCLYKDTNAVVSQYFGDLANSAVADEYQNSVSDLSRLLSIRPQLAVCDLHPRYHSAGFAKTLGIPLLYAQHHHAHIASVMAEHNIEGKVIGVAFDGTGYGTDGNIWGAEFLICEGAHFLRAAHMRYTPIIGGDISMKDAKKTAACFLTDAGLNRYIDDDRKDIIAAAIGAGVNTVLSSGMGRLFDAISSILGIKHQNSYEGECAAALEAQAALAITNNTVPQKLKFTIEDNADIITIDPRPVLEDICEARECASVGAIALGFHMAVSDMIADVCRRIRERQGINTVAISGGVFANTVLTERTLTLLRRDGFNVYRNVLLPPNDGAISLGQTYIGLRHSREEA